MDAVAFVCVFGRMRIIIAADTAPGRGGKRRRVTGMEKFIKAVIGIASVMAVMTAASQSLA